MCEFKTYKEALEGKQMSTEDYVKIMTLFIDLCCEVEKHHPELLDPICEQIHEMTYGPHYTKELAELDVAKLVGQDGTRGGHWTLEQTKEVAHSKGVHFDGKFNCYDFYYMMNVWYSDHKKTTEGNADFIADQVLETLNDADGVEGFAWYYGRMRKN